MGIVRDFSSEFRFNSSRSSGAGGQNVNKVNTKVELRFNIENSELLTREEKETLLLKLASKINNAGELLIVSQTERSQLRNKDKTVEKFYSIIKKALTPKKKRKPTQLSASVKAKRLEQKRLHSRRKINRKSIKEEE
jgi:ribosome-associated protein